MFSPVAGAALGAGDKAGEAAFTGACAAQARAALRGILVHLFPLIHERKFIAIDRAGWKPTLSADSLAAGSRSYD